MSNLLRGTDRRVARRVVVTPGIVLGLVAISILAMGAVSLEDDRSIVVVNVSRILEEHPEALAAEKRLTAEYGAKKAVYDALLAEIDALKAARKAAEAGSPEWRKLDRDLRKKTDEARFTAKDLDRAFQEELMKSFEGLMADLEDVIVRYCRKSGFDLCLKVDSGPMQAPEAGVWSFVIYRDPRLDITDEILEIVKKA